MEEKMEEWIPASAIRWLRRLAANSLLSLLQFFDVGVILMDIQNLLKNGKTPSIHAL
jgi:hypothetical protein